MLLPIYLPDPLPPCPALLRQLEAAATGALSCLAVMAAVVVTNAVSRGPRCSRCPSASILPDTDYVPSLLAALYARLPNFVAPACLLPPPACR